MRYYNINTKSTYNLEKMSTLHLTLLSSAMALFSASWAALSRFINPAFNLASSSLNSTLKILNKHFNLLSHKDFICMMVFRVWSLFSEFTVVLYTFRCPDSWMLWEHSHTNCVMHCPNQKCNFFQARGTRCHITPERGKREWLAETAIHTRTWIFNLEKGLTVDLRGFL